MGQDIPSTVIARRDGARETTAILANGDIMVMKPMNLLLMIVVRAARVYFQSFWGMLTAAGLGAVAINHGLDGHMTTPVGGWQVFLTAAYLALFPAAASVIHNAAELFTKLDEKFPQMRA